MNLIRLQILIKKIGQAVSIAKKGHKLSKETKKRLVMQTGVNQDHG